MKFLFDFLPLIVFFAAYLTVDVFFATASAMVVTAIQVAWSWLKYRRIDMMLRVSFGAIMVLGGLTLLLHDKRFIMFKPTLVYWLIAGGLLVSNFKFGKNPVQLMLREHFDAPPAVWRRWLLVWAGFCALIGVLNLFVAHNFSELHWVQFKVFGVVTLTVVLSVVQTWRLMPYMKEETTH